MAVEVQNAPFINEEFKVTGAWGEQRETHRHAGIDLQTVRAFQTGIGQPVYAMEEGIVTRVDQTDQNTGYGALCIVFNEETKNLWLYGDLGDWSVRVARGDRVTKGQQIAIEGNPAGTQSSGLHVHVEKENQPDGRFRFGWDFSIDPTTGTGIENKVNYINYIYKGTTPPTPTKDKKHGFNWPVFTRPIRARRQFM